MRDPITTDAPVAQPVKAPVGPTKLRWNPLSRFLGRERRRKWLGQLSLHLLLLVVGLIWAYPFLWTVSASLKTQAEMYSGALNLIPVQPTLDNYVRAWDKARFSTYFLNTVILAVCSTLLVVTICLLTGYVLGRYSFPGKRIIIGAFIGCMFIPQGYTIIPIFDLLHYLGLLNSRAGLILAESGWGYTLLVLLVAAAFHDIPEELADAAVLDGCGFVQVFTAVMVPLVRPAVAAASIMQFMWSWNSYFLPLVLTLSRPELRTLGVGMFAFRGSHVADWTGLTAAATLSILPIVIFFLALQRFFVEGLSGAVKG